MLLAYLVSPFLSLGVFLHVLQDSFTTCKDLGCEWFYPISRLVKRGLYDENGHPQHENFDELVCFYQEDPHALVEHADNDLWDEGPSPWRRVYGPAQNSSLLNRGFLYCSIAIIVLWVFMPNVSNLDYLLSITLTRYFILFFWIYFCGDSFPSRRTGPKRPTAQSAQIQLREIPNFALGLILFSVWLFAYRAEILANLETIYSNLIPVLLGVGIVILVILAVIKWQTRTGKTPALV